MPEEIHHPLAGPGDGGQVGQDQVAVGRGRDQVVAITAVDRAVPQAARRCCRALHTAEDRIVARAGVDRVIARPGGDGIVPVAAKDRGRTITGRD